MLDAQDCCRQVGMDFFNSQIEPLHLIITFKRIAAVSPGGHACEKVSNCENLGYIGLQSISLVL